MKYIEVSKKIRLTREAGLEEVKKALTDRLRRAFKIDSIKETENGFLFQGTTGKIGGFMRHARVDLDVRISKNQEYVRVMVHGQSMLASKLVFTYGFLFLVVLFAGLLPGSIETGADSSGALDALVFIVFGIFTYFDVSKKLNEPELYLEAILNSLDTEFG